MKQDYELVVILNPSLSQEESSNIKARISGLITNNGGAITGEEEWGNRRLAYAIRRTGQTYLEGNYFLTRFNTDRSAVKEMEGSLRLSEQVLRFLLVKSEPPQPVVSEAVAVENQETVAIENQETVAIENQEAVAIENQEAVAIENQEAVAIENQEAVAIENQEAVAIENQEAVAIENQEAVAIENQE